MPLIKFSSEVIFELVAVLKSSISLVFDWINNFLSPSATPLADIACVLLPIDYFEILRIGQRNTTSCKRENSLRNQM